MRLSIRQLEERIALDAAHADSDDASLDTAAQEAAAAESGDDPLIYTERLSDSAGGEIIFVDGRVKDAQELLDSINPDGSREVYLLDPAQGGIEQITAILSGRTDLGAVHILSHGNSGNFWLGTDFVSSQNVEKYAAAFSQWGGALTEDADILIYGCNLAKTAEGEALVGRIAEYTGADVAASTDVTGSDTFGGDWELEYEAGTIEATSISTEGWDHKLATYVVDTLADGYPGAATSLREAIIAANAAFGPDTIVFAPGVVGTIGLTYGDMYVYDDVSILGPGSGALAIDAGGSSRIFDISNADVSMSGLTLTGGYSNYGGAIRLYGGSLSIADSVITGNIAPSTGYGSNYAYGGAIYARNTTLTIQNTIISGNRAFANSNGSYIFANAYGGGLFLNFTTAYIRNSTISANAADAYAYYAPNSSYAYGRARAQGGGIFSRYSNLYIEDSTVSGNNATADADMSSYYSGYFTYSYAEARARAYGGGLLVQGGTLTIENSTISGNSANASSDADAYAFSGYYYGNANARARSRAYAYGGGIDIRSTATTIVNSTVSGNTALANANARAYTGYYYANTSTYASADARAGSNGGGINASNYSGVGIYNSTIASNTSSGASSALTDGTANAFLYAYGGGIYQSGYAVYLGSTIVADNSATTGRADVSGTFSAAYSLIEDPSGAAIYGPSNILYLDPILGSLANNGGPTMTHALQAGSPALDAGSNPGGLLYDQRGVGYPRSEGGAVDIGSFEEAVPATAVDISKPPQPPPPPPNKPEPPDVEGLFGGVAGVLDDVRRGFNLEGSLQEVFGGRWGGTPGGYSRLAEIINSTSELGLPSAIDTEVWLRAKRLLALRR